MTVAELTFKAMASAVQVILVDPAAGAQDYARRRLEELERRWSRFVPASDISRLNTSPEALIMVSPDTILLLSTMMQAWRLTGRRYDPAMLSAIVEAGYSTSIDGSGRTSRMTGLPARGRSFTDVMIDPATSAVMVPTGVGLDPGGIGKGLAADLVVIELLAGGTGGALVSVGGDLAAAGTAPTPEGWLVAVEHPLDSSREFMTLALEAGGIATSSTLTRTWSQNGDRRHHVIDPATGTCATTDLAAVTVIARAGWEAEAHATAALLCGSERALDYLDGHQLAGIAMTLDGAVRMSPALERVGVTERSTACTSA
jgi:thiamine biosynthesis lipoprotein